MTQRVPTAVVHLVRRANGFEPFETFMTSYEHFEAELEHDLVLLFKGFSNDADVAPYLDRAADSAPRRVVVPDRGLDLTAYLAAATFLDHKRVCFVNSFSEIRAAGWLRVLHEAQNRDRVGAAGATGSWASSLSYELWQLGMPSRYSEVFDSRRDVRRAMHGLAGTGRLGGVAAWLHMVADCARHLPAMRLFPAFHVRTNAFLIDRELFRSLRAMRLVTKAATHRMESGRASMTAQLQALGRPAVVVDRHGVARRGPDWHTADVFWQGDQQDLLVADNQTRAYATGSGGQRAVLSGLAWGTAARPSTIRSIG